MLVTVEWREFLCQQCKHKFKAQIMNGVVVDAWIAHLKSIQCPECHAPWKKLSFVIERGPVRADFRFPELEEAKDA